MFKATAFAVVAVLIGVYVTGPMRSLLPSEVNTPHMLPMLLYFAAPELVYFAAVGLLVPLFISKEIRWRGMAVSVLIIVGAQAVMYFGLASYAATSFRGYITLAAPLIGAALGFVLGALVALGIDRATNALRRRPA